MLKTTIVTIGLVGLWTATPAEAQQNPMQVCGAKYQAAKKANQLPAGQSWSQFLSACRAGLTKSAPSAAVAAKAGKAVAPRAAKAPSGDQLAARDRQKKCGAMWKADKAAGKVAAGQTWPKYWSACNARLKG